jgi:hypothetical protein
VTACRPTHKIDLALLLDASSNGDSTIFRAYIGDCMPLNSDLDSPYFAVSRLIRFKFKVKVTLRLVAYRQLVRLGAKPLETLLFACLIGCRDIASERIQQRTPLPTILLLLRDGAAVAEMCLLCHRLATGEKYSTHISSHSRVFMCQPSYSH